MTYSTVHDGSGVVYSVKGAVDYFPYGKVLREYHDGEVEKYLSTQHERDQETGLDYRGARFYDSDVARFLSLDPLAKKYVSWSPYNYVLGNPLRNIDPDGRDVKVTSKEKKGKEHIKIKYRGVLMDKTGHLSKKQLRQYKRGIKSQLRESFSGGSETRSWKMKVKLRVGKQARGNGSGRESTIQLVRNQYGSNTHFNGFDAEVAINTFTGSVAKSAAHEVGHTIGLPHAISGKVASAPPFTSAKTKLISSNNPMVGNLMLPGNFPKEIRGTDISESQILHIQNDYEDGNLNRADISGADTEWGDLPSDSPVYQFNHSPLFGQSLNRIQ